MYPKIDATVVLAKCQEGKKTYGVRMEKTNLGWRYDWAFKISDQRAKAENYNETKITGAIYPDEKYPGCPYCGGKSFIICGTCGHLNCHNMKGKIFTCEWCGAQGELTSYDGAGITSSGDI